MASDTNRNKRRKIAADTHVGISNLPDGLLADVATYLSKPTRAIFAMAMTASSSSWRKFHLMGPLPSAEADAILSSTESWDSLDFGGIEEDLAEKLTDDDLCSILLCTNAKTTLKSLKLTGCIKIVGSGLEPLRGSIILQQIDLSLVGYHEDPDLESEPSISEAAVLPILDSTLDMEGNSLKHIQLPANWRHRASTELEQFLERYNILMNNQRLCCSQCDDVIVHAADEYKKWHVDGSGFRYFGLQNYTCCVCVKHFCGGHTDDGEGGPLRFCGTCARYYCTSCNLTLEMCDQCEIGVCNECGGLTECGGCEENVCELCIHTCEGCDETQCEECLPFVACVGEDCYKEHCEDCFDGKDYGVSRCDVCEKEYCLNCRHLDCSKEDGKDACHGCERIIARKLTPRLKEDVEKLRREIKELRSENEEVRLI